MKQPMSHFSIPPPGPRNGSGAPARGERLARWLPWRRWAEQAAERKPGGLLWQIRLLQQGKWVVYYDGGCSFCRRWVSRGERAALSLVQWRDFRAHRAEVAHLNPRFDRAAYLIIGGRVALPGFLGFRRLLLAMPVLWPLLPFLYLPGSRRVGEALYRGIAVRYGPVRPAAESKESKAG